MSALACAEILPHLESYRRSETSPELSLLIDEHLARCPPCRRRLAHLTQLSSMMSAWRPAPVPRGLRIEAAEAVSQDLADLAAATPLQERFRTERRKFLPPLTAYQRAANWLVVAALLFLAAAIAVRLWQRRHVVTEPPRNVPVETHPGDVPARGDN